MTFFKHILSFVVGVVILISTSSSFAADYFFEQDKKLKKGYTVFVTAYDPRLGGVYEIQTVQDKMQKNHYTRLGDLSVASSKVDRNKLKRRPKKLVGKSFKIDKAPLTTYKAPRHIN